MRNSNWILCAVMVLAVATSTILSQPSPGEECGQVTTEAGDQASSIPACMDELLDEQLLMIDAVEQMDGEMRAFSRSLLSVKGISSITESRLLVLMENSQDDIQLMRDQLDRARAENSAVEDADYDVAFEKADQQKGKKCKFSDLPFFESLEGEFPPGLKPFSGSSFDPKFGDGKCNVFKARIDNPGEPDDNEVVRINERSENMCERACEDREGSSSSSFFASGASARPKKEERRERTVFSLTDNIGAARRANDKLQMGMAKMSALRLRVESEAFRISTEDNENCEPVDVARGLDEAAEVVGLAKNAVAVVTAALELAKETARPPTKQDAAGFNASSAETPFSVAVGISKIVEQSLGFIEQELKVGALIAGRIQDFAEAQCLKNVQTQVAALQETADQTSAQLMDLQARVEMLNALLDEALELLRTAPGRRDGFPKNQ